MVIGLTGPGVVRRRLLAVAAAGMLAVAACSGGSSGNPSADTSGKASTELPPCPLDALDQAQSPVEVVVWHSLVAKQNDTMNELAAQYNASQSKVRVRMENVAATDEELLRLFDSAVPTRDLPGIFVANDTMTQTMADSGVVLPAQSCIDADNYDLSPFSPTVTAYYTINGVLWAGSANPGSALIYYNKDHFRRAGLDPEKPPQTLAEVRTDAEALKRAGVTEHPLVHEVASYKTEFWLTGAHAPIVDNTNGRSAAATESALVGNDDTGYLFDWFDKMNKDGLLTPIPVSEGQINQYLAFAQEQASMAIETSSASTSIEAFMAGNLQAPEVGIDAGTTTNVSGLAVGAGAFPGIHAPGKTQMGGPAWFIISSQPSDVQAAAWDFIKFMNSEPAQVRMLTGGSYLPYRTSAASTPEAQQFFSSSLAGGWLRIANEQVASIDPSFPGPLIGPYDQVRLALRDALTTELFEGTPPAEAIAQADTRINDVLRAYEQGGF